MNVLLTGANGQVARELIYTCPDNIKLFAFDKNALDITNQISVKEAFEKYKPDVLINAAAYTSVERAEIEQDLAYKINKEGISNLAIECASSKTKLIHYSTDYIFDGKKTSPYSILDKTSPLNVYGKSKLEGEEEALKLNPNKTLIIRTSWIYSKHGNNFVKTMLRLMDVGNNLEVIADQTGTPTWARSIAKATWKFIKEPEANGIFHFCDSGSTSWFEFAKSIQESALKYKIIDSPAKLIPIKSVEYKSKVERPSYSILDCKKTWELINVKPENWRVNLNNMIKDYIL